MTRHGAPLMSADLDAHAALDDLGVPRVREVTAESITVTEIRGLRIRFGRGDARAQWCDVALGLLNAAQLGLVPRDQFRSRLAAAYNALPTTERQLTLLERIRLLGAERDRLREEARTLRAVVDHPVDRGGS